MKISDAAYRWIIRDKNNEIPCISASYQLLLRNCICVSIVLLLINHFIPIWNCYYFIAILVLDRILECIQKLLRGLKNQKLFAFSGIFYTGVFVSLNLVKICYFKQGVVALLQSTIISKSVTIFLILLLEKRLRKIQLGKNFGSLQKEMLKYSIPLVPSNLSWWVMGSSDRYIIRWILGSASNGIYAVAYKFPSVLSTIFVMFNNAWTDQALADLDKSRESEEYASKVFQIYYRISFGFVFVLIPATKVIAQIILSQRYKMASVYIAFLYLGTIFQGFSSFFSVGYLHQKKTGGTATTSIYGAIANIIVHIALIKFIGLFAAAFSTFVGFFIMWIFRVNDTKESFPIRINKKRFGFYLLVAMFLSLCTIWSSIQIDILLTVIMIVFFIIDNRVLIMEMKNKILTNIKLKRKKIA
ncbi:lipopolysaccharide biosynthesis protein [Acetivibrio straminisolvens]|uniref:Polysaccharide biosynthesis protein CpsM n=2 Tax=Acetivibrio straminisolvens TaxID=253314 RepID=W4V9T9_9FIRM|nr:oligosaccharide flippase family protein [Acetivibrio straminisolvens]GAE89926.1 polysaccharide biosynthesis protein CpsM [Acetivibrio straminisolvens JCM 21531]